MNTSPHVPHDENRSRPGTLSYSLSRPVGSSTPNGMVGVWIDGEFHVAERHVEIRTGTVQQFRHGTDVSDDDVPGVIEELAAARVRQIEANDTAEEGCDS